MVTIDECVEQISTLVGEEDIFGLVVFLGTTTSIASDERIRLDLLIDNPSANPEVIERYNEQYSIEPRLGIYHPSQYLMRIFWDNVTRIGPSLVAYSVYQKAIQKHTKALEKLLVKEPSPDSRRQTFNERFNCLLSLAKLYSSDIDALVQNILRDNEVKKESREKRTQLAREAELYLPEKGTLSSLQGFKAILDEEEYNDIKKDLEEYLRIVKQLKDTSAKLLELVSNRHDVIRKDLAKVRENFPGTKEVFMERVREFAELFPVKTPGRFNQVDKKTLLSLSTTFYYRFFDFFGNQKYPMPIVVMPGRNYDVTTSSRIYVNENGEIIVREDADEIQIKSRTLYKNGILYLASDLDLGLDPKTLFSKRRGRHIHWPPVPEVARLFGKYVFWELLKLKEISTKRDREKLLGIYDDKGNCSYNSQGRDTYATSVINYYSQLPPASRTLRFGENPRKYDEQTWAELFSLHFAYWLVSKRLSDNPGLASGSRHEFYGPTDGFHMIVYKWFDTHFLKKKSLQPDDKLPS